MRTIRPETFTSETLANVPVSARWTFAGLWTYADDEGRGRAEPRLIKGAIWPLDDDVTAKDVAVHLDALEAEGLICRYEHGGKGHLHIVNFAEHQKPNRPTPSKLPACPKGTHGGLSEPSVSPHSGIPQSRKGDSPESQMGDSTGSASQRPGGPPKPEERNARNGHTRQASDVPAGQGQLTEDSVSLHGALTTNSFTNTPTPSPTCTGVGDGDGNVGGDGDGKTSEADPATPDSRPDVERLCAHLADRVAANGSKRPQITKKWRTAARLMLDRDGRTEEQIRGAIDWSQNHEFWRGNVMSMPKLREQYDRMRLQAESARARATPGQRRSTADERVAQGQALKDQFRRPGDQPPDPPANTIPGEIIT
ncbi:hypothetical protein [Actinomadura bangladeshensis]|uniref:Uncharacterized protein n=1 Tax=Actinomadura bangladeshensis TaxID=453573 RepID=A0A6L9QBD6_9ACTN|nr:hypothetical protein [Actinomadura bangladeshensis]NEA21574.1 hypothetical protein [Actinomadura bangladeshensis]NEA22534.1 hypothetical protein [Actinomadura bangladeshensis]